MDDEDLKLIADLKAWSAYMDDGDVSPAPYDDMGDAVLSIVLGKAAARLSAAADRERELVDALKITERALVLLANHFDLDDMTPGVERAIAAARALQAKEPT